MLMSNPSGKARRLEHSLSPHSKAWLRYWRASLLDAARLQPGDRNTKRWSVTIKGLNQGRVELIPGQPPLPKLDAEAQEVLIAPYTLSTKVRHGASSRSRPKELFTCLIPAVLNPDYSLGFHTRGVPPFLTREVLEPCPTTSRVTLATLDHYDDVLASWSRRWGNASTWQDVWELTHLLFQAVCPPKNWEEAIKGSGFEWRCNEAVLVQSTSQGGAASAILSVLDDLLETKRCPGALAAMVPRVEERDRRLVWTPKQAHKALHRHLGHMSSIYALSSSQRQALGHFLYGEDQVFAINGPPGTGKTTLLHDVVASLLVQHALEGMPPPIVVVSSTNNQAVTNVLDSMSSVGDVHLLPGLATLGVYLPSRSRAQQGQEHYLTATEHQGTPPYAIHGPEAAGGDLLKTLLSSHSSDTHDVERAFLEAAQAYHGMPKSMDSDKVMQWARSEMQRLVAFMKLGLNTYLAREEGRARVQKREARKWWERTLKLLGLFGQRTLHAEAEFLEAMVQRGVDPSHIRGERLNQWEDQGDTDPTSPQNWLDVHIRRRLFELAVCYYEASFFVEQRQRSQSALRHNRRTPQALLAWWRHVAMLAPVFVTTMYSGPKFFRAQNGERLYEDIDLLIVDEAGQVAPELCVAMMSLAKRALVVGDVQQLEPVWSIPKEVDWANIHGLNLSSLHNVSLLESTGAMASNGSVMKMAQQASSVEVPDFAPGALLREHRRCPEQIITFCNDLAYGGLIRPMKPNKKEGPFPHFGYAHVKGHVETSHGSRRNPEEAYAIADWVHRRTSQLLDYYGEKHLRDIVAVVTPFRAQVQLLKERMADFSSALAECTVGTVHSLQGAERPVVLFSPVYTTISSPGRLFFDRSVSMLNVAASRSKDAFMVFGDMEIFKDFGRDPSSILARHLLGANGVEIPDIYFRKVPVQKYLINDLERHRSALEWAIKKATSALHIASPWITESALMEDELLALFQHTDKKVDIHLYINGGNYLQNKQSIANINALHDQVREVEGNIRLHDCDRLHSKLVICDDNTYIMGSFNWLSAVRREGSDQFKYYETSTIHTRDILDNVGEWCTALVSDLQERVIDPPRWSQH